MEVTFPTGFLWGTATAAHQVEGNNVYNDSWLLEHLPDTIYAEPSGDACDQYHRFREDIALIGGIGRGERARSCKAFEFFWMGGKPGGFLCSGFFAVLCRDCGAGLGSPASIPFVVLISERQGNQDRQLGRSGNYRRHCEPRK